MKSHKASITVHQKTWHQTCLAFMLLALKKTTTKTYFLHYDILVKTLYYILCYTCYYTETFPHSYA